VKFGFSGCAGFLFGYRLVFVIYAQLLCKISVIMKPETVKKTLVNQMVLCFGIMFASQDSQGMLSLLSVIQQCLKAGKKQQWRTASLTNICAGLLAGLKALHALRPQQLTTEVLSSGQAIFQVFYFNKDGSSE
jgi:hypothetical protein